MGLNAIVFRNVNTLKKEFAEQEFDVDPETGESMVKSDHSRVIPRSKLVAASNRLGNLDEIRSLREKVRAVLSEESSLILKKILYSATHSGDSVGFAEFEQLSAETRLLRRSSDPQLTQFITSLDQLVAAGRAEQNPIVFV